MQTVTRLGRESIVAIIFSVLLVLSLFLPFVSAPIAGAEGGNDKVVLGYYTSWSPPGDDFDPNKITHLNYSFGDICWDGEHGNPNNEEIPEGDQKVWPCTDLDGEENVELADGTIVMYEPEVDLVELPKVAALKNKNPNLKTLLSIGGWTLSHNLSDVAADPEARQVLADSAVDFIREYDMDGLDLDWEYPVRPDWGAGHPLNAERDEDPENFLLLVKDIRAALDAAEATDGSKYLLTMAGGQQDWFIDGLPLAEASEYMDYLAVMTYDTNGTWDTLTGHNAPLGGIDGTDSEVAARGWTNGNVGRAATKMGWAGVPSDKIVVGLAFYGQAWQGCNVENEGKFQPANGAHQTCVGGAADVGTQYGEIKALLDIEGYDYHWDDEAKVPYLYNAETTEFISYDNPESISHKVNYIKDSNLGGAMIWDLATDDADYNLLRTVASGLGLDTDTPEVDPNQPEYSEVELVDDKAVEVKANSKVTFGEVGSLVLPANLPAGTKLTVKDAETDLAGKAVANGFGFAGSAYTFDLDIDAEYAGKYIISLPIPDGLTTNPVLGYYNEASGWEVVEGSDVRDGYVIAEVDHFSTYAVLAGSDVVVDEESVETIVYSGGTIEGPNGDYKIVLPNDLPVGTTFKAAPVDSDEVDSPGLTIAGVVYNFDFDYAGEVDYSGEFQLSLKAEKNASYPVVFKLNTESDEWDKVGGTLSNGYVPVELGGFSTYGVFTIDPVKGDTGEQGEAGSAGPQGKPGETGSTGPQGKPGESGQSGGSNKEDENDSGTTIEDGNDDDDKAEKKESGKALPKTATNSFNLLVVGLVVLLVGGSGAYFFNRRKKSLTE